jgi:serine/threonine-protein kinase RsbT
MNNETRMNISSAADIVTARQRGRSLAMKLGFSGSDLTMIATAISEIARNIVDHAQSGEMVLTPTQEGPRRGISITARDRGPGIPDITRAMQYGYSTRRGLGVGLPGAKSLMDEFEIQSKVRNGTTVRMTKWLT